MFFVPKISFSRLSSFFPLLLVLITAWVAINTSFNKDYKTGKIESDARGYYAYLPAIFIYNDLTFGFINEIEFNKYNNPRKFYKYYNTHEGKIFNKYYVGTAIMLSPFFLIGHAITLTTDLPTDGYSYYYTAMVHVGALFYLLIGLIGLQKLLRAFKYKEWVIGLTLIFILLGTNLFYYVITEFAMSHLYSFTAITWFCFFIWRYFQHPARFAFLLASAALLALIVLIRPINGLIVFVIPFLAGSYENMLAGFTSIFKNVKWLLVAIIIFLLIVSVQFIIYQIGIGSFYLFSYKGERFDFLHPNILKFLFSYKKGFFLYTPMMLVALAGLIPIIRSRRFMFYSAIVFLFLIVYVLSSWEMWYYGGSFSQRVMIDFYVPFAILLAAIIQKVEGAKYKNWFFALLVVLLLINQVQIYQYRRAIIHWSEMTKERYWDVFMRVDRL